MESHVLGCANKIIQLVPFNSDLHSFLSAVYHQVRYLALPSLCCSLPELLESVKRDIVDNEIYGILPARHDSQILRYLVRYLKVAFEVHYTSGFLQGFPCHYRLGEPAIRLLSLPDGYGSITKVSSLNITIGHTLKRNFYFR